MAEENKLSPQVSEYYNKGLFAFEKKNYEYAIQLFSQALSMKNDFADARHYLHLSAQRIFEQRPPSGLIILLYRIGNFPTLLKAFLFEKLNRIPAAICEYEKALIRDSRNTSILMRLAQDLLKEKDKPSALKVFEEIRAIDPSNISALKNSANLYSQLDNLPAARKCYQAVLEAVPHEPDAEKGIKNLDALGVIKESFNQKDTDNT